MKHMKAMHRVMNHCLGTPNKGFTLQPNGAWNGSKDFKFIVEGLSDSDCAKDPETRHSVTGTSTFLNGAVVNTRSKMQRCVTLSATEAEHVAAVERAQDMLFIMRLLESMGLQVQKPMILRVDNKGAVDLANNWSVAGRTRHIATKINFLREMKEEGLIKVVWCSNEHMASDIFTKNVGNPDFDRHSKSCVSDD